MVTSFAAGGLVDLVPELAVMLGANAGTTLIVQALSFDMSRVSFLFILIGAFMFRRSTVTIMTGRSAHFYERTLRRTAYRQCVKQRPEFDEWVFPSMN
jgi:hypothetical protein